MANKKTNARKPASRAIADADPSVGANFAKRVASDRIAADLVSFRKAGGRIEVLGVTPVLKKLHTKGTSSHFVQTKPATDPDNGSH